MELATLKPLLSTLAMPPASLLLLAVLGWLLALRKRRTGMALMGLALVMLWALSCHGTAVWLARNALPQYEPVTAAALKAGKAQAVVVLGGGVVPLAPEYGRAQPSAPTLARLRYGVLLARQAALPMAFAGGLGWAAHEGQKESEAEVAQRVAGQEYGIAIRWSESRSRDTVENARLLAPMLARDGVQRIALVTDAAHMPRAQAAFQNAGLMVMPAPTGYVLPVQAATLEWLPSAYGLWSSRQVIHEWLGLVVSRFH